MATQEPGPKLKSGEVETDREGTPGDPLGTASILVARVESLQPLQASVQERGFLTARYRLRSGPVFGNLLAAFAADVQRMRRGESGDVRGDLLPQPAQPEWSNLLADPGWDALDELAYMPGLADGGSLGPQWLGAFSQALRQPDRRLLLLCEVERDPGDTAEWHAALDSLLGGQSLPWNVALVFTDAPPGWQGTRPDPRTDEIEVVSEGATDREEVITFAEAALSGDQPADVDRLGVAPLANALARLLLLPQTRPLTVGVQAPWGWGKSSFVAFVREALIRGAPSNLDSSESEELARLDRQLSDADPGEMSDADAADAVATHREQRRELLEQLERRAYRDVICVSFNAWRYEGSQQVWAGLARTLTAGLEAAVPRSARLRSRLTYAIRRRRLEFWMGFVVPVVLAIVAAVAAVLLGVADAGDELSGWSGWLETLVPVASVLFIAWRFFGVVQPVSERVAGYVKGPDYGSRMGYQHEVIEDLKFLRDRIPSKPRIVVAVDDLDRCSDESIMETLQAINLVLGASDFFVVLAIDPDMIHRAIARQRGLRDEDELAETFAEDYLRKIIQLPLHLPRRTAQQRFGFVSQLFSPAAQREYHAARNGQGGGEQPDAGPPPQPDGARMPFAWSPAAIVPPRVQVLRQVQDTKEELQALQRYEEFLRDNPRELKRLVNVHRLVKILVQRPDVAPTTEHQRKLVAWLVFCARWPSLVDDVLACAVANADDADCVATVQAAHKDTETGTELKRFVAQLDGDKLSATDLAADGALATAARISQLVRDRPAPRA
jgi:hypothetical protein